MSELTNAQEELVLIEKAINEYVQGKRRTSFIIWSGGNKRQYDYDSPAELFSYLTARRAELIRLIKNLSSTSAIPNFTQNSNIPLVFRRY